MPNLIFEKVVVVFALLVESSCKVRKYLVEKYTLVDLFYSVTFSLIVTIVLLVLMKVLFFFRIVRLAFYELPFIWLKKLINFSTICLNFSLIIKIYRLGYWFLGIIVFS